MQYREILGRGAFKTVYKAFNEEEGIEVAWNQVRVNEIVTTQEQKDRLMKEIEMLKRMSHQCIITLYESWVDEENMTVNFITELFTAGSLRQCVNPPTIPSLFPFPPSETVSLPYRLPRKSTMPPLLTTSLSPALPRPLGPPSPSRLVYASHPHRNARTYSEPNPPLRRTSVLSVVLTRLALAPSRSFQVPSEAQER